MYDQNIYDIASLCWKPYQNRKLDKNYVLMFYWHKLSTWKANIRQYAKLNFLPMYHYTATTTTYLGNIPEYWVSKKNK